MKERNLDGVYFRVNRNNKWRSVCWTDLTDAEREEIGFDCSIEWWKGLAMHLTKVIISIGEQLDLVAELE